MIDRPDCRDRGVGRCGWRHTSGHEVEGRARHSARRATIASSIAPVPRRRHGSAETPPTPSTRPGVTSIRTRRSLSSLARNSVISPRARSRPYAAPHCSRQTRRPFLPLAREKRACPSWARCSLHSRGAVALCEMNSWTWTSLGRVWGARRWTRCPSRSLEERRGRPRKDAGPASTDRSKRRA